MTLIRGENGLPAEVPIITCTECGRNCDERIHGSDSLRPGDLCDSDDCPSRDPSESRPPADTTNRACNTSLPAALGSGSE